ncbi:MAG: TIGR01440 family protein [Bacilli bacterium]
MEPFVIESIKEELQLLLQQFSEQQRIPHGSIIVIGCSTSEVLGENIGTYGSEEVASILFETLARFSNRAGWHLAFQCCEHLNRALVVSQETMRRYSLEQVSVVPVSQAGGAMAAYAFNNFDKAVVVESVKASAGIDIGQTLIGMHIKAVAVPVRVTQRTIGAALVTLAVTRPKLIGGARAVYEK